MDEIISGSSLPTEFTSKKCKNSKYQQSYDTHIRQVAEENFSKKFHFQNDHKWRLPPPQDLFKNEKWKNDDLIIKKIRLNNEKSKLNHYNLKAWHQHTRNMNIAGDVINLLKRRINPEFLTQAWCKFYEVLGSYTIIPEWCILNRKLNTIHLCEAPGAFIAAINHYLQLNYPLIKWNWIGSTLNPYYEGNELSEMISDDRFIMHTLQNWWFGDDFTGNLHKQSNIEGLINVTHHMGPISLITADGSIDCQNDPGEQECRVSSLHYSETITSLNLLSKGGSFVIKIFTVYECETVCLLYLLCCVFKSVNMFKPVTSKEGNSETYVVCLEYIGKYEIAQWITVLNLNYGENASNKAMFSRDAIPTSFIQQVIKCTEFFQELQVNVLSRNIITFEKGTDKKTMLKTAKLRKCIAELFIKKYVIRSLSYNNSYIVGHENLNNTPVLNLEKKNEEGSFEERRTNTNLEKENFLFHLQHSLNCMNAQWEFTENIYWIMCTDELLHNEVPDYYFITGKPIHVINNSKFCIGGLLKIRNQLESLFTSSEKEDSAKNIEFFMSHLSDIETSTIHKCDTSLYSWHSNVHKAQVEAFNDIYSAMQNVKNEHSLLLTGFPLLSQFNVGLVYFLAYMFEQVGFFNPVNYGYAIIFYKFKSSNALKIFSQISDKIALSINLSLITLLPITYLCCHDWYKVITITNQIVLRESSMNIIQKLLK